MTAATPLMPTYDVVDGNTNECSRERICNSTLEIDSAVSHSDGATGRNSTGVELTRSELRPEDDDTRTV